MKSFLLYGMLFLSTTTIWSQDTLQVAKIQEIQKSIENQSAYFISLGVNAIDNGGSSLPLDGTFSFNAPFFISGEYRFKSNWSAALTLSTNSIVQANSYQSYFSIDAAGIYNFDKNIYDTNKIKMFAGLGLGNNFIASKGNASFNVIVGARYWFSKNYGVVLQSIGKISLNSMNHTNTNHYQYSIGMVWRN